MFKYEIRTATVADLSHMAAIEEEADAIFPDGILPQNSFTLPIDVLKKALLQQTLVVAVADDSSQLVGFAASTPRSNFLHLNQVSVHPDHGRQGLGRRLVSQIIQIAEKKGMQGVTLNTFGHIPWNAPFYESFGFVSLSETALRKRPELNYLRNNLERENAFGLKERVAMLLEIQ